MRTHRVALSVLEPHGRALVELNGREIVLFRVEGEIHAFANACPHEGNPLIEGEIRGDTLTCAYHLWRFDLRTGACLVGDESATRYKTEVRDGDVLIEID
jgi:nitrite reductase/ring-hydroxylating ferredoxin subunit